MGGGESDFDVALKSENENVEVLCYPHVNRYALFEFRFFWIGVFRRGRKNGVARMDHGVKMSSITDAVSPL